MLESARTNRVDGIGTGRYAASAPQRKGRVLTTEVPVAEEQVNQENHSFAE